MRNSPTASSESQGDLRQSRPARNTCRRAGWRAGGDIRSRRIADDRQVGLQIARRAIGPQARDDGQPRCVRRLGVQRQPHLRRASRGPSPMSKRRPPKPRRRDADDDHRPAADRERAARRRRDRRSKARRHSESPITTAGSLRPTVARRQQAAALGPRAQRREQARRDERRARAGGFASQRRRPPSARPAPPGRRYRRPRRSPARRTPPAVNDADSPAPPDARQPVAIDDAGHGRRTAGRSARRTSPRRWPCRSRARPPPSPRALARGAAVATCCAARSSSPRVNQLGYQPPFTLIVWPVR